MSAPESETRFVRAMESLNRRIVEADARKAARIAQERGHEPLDLECAETVHQASLRLLVLSHTRDDRELADALHDIAHELMRSPK